MVSKRWPSLSENQPYHLSSGNHWTALLFFSCLPFDNMHFPILESVWKNLPCRQYYAAAKHLFLLELFISLSLFFFAQCELQYARLLVTVYVDHFFWTQGLGLCPEVVCVWFLLQTRQAYHTRCTFKAKAGLVAQCLCYGNRFITNSK